ncbi:MAG TPA: hypothetical protein VI699_07365 [Candidatus Acidoferrales bacterium]|nr:hypothetical protein [Candidatus Acidoferrales bacterium]
MYGWALLAIAAMLLADADVPRVTYLRPPRPSPPVEIPPGQSIPVLPDLTLPAEPQQPAKKSDRLQPESRLQLVRYISGEFVKLVKPLPGGKKGFRIQVGQPLNEQVLRQLLANNGAAGSSGDMVQITKIEFKSQEIVLDINGGGKGRTRWRDRIQIQMGGSMPQATVTDSRNVAPVAQGQGATLILDFGRPLPDITVAEMKQTLADFLDFSKARSAAVHWVDTLPPQIQKAIQEQRVEVGMDREMVIAAIGRPERKVREKDPEGGFEIEDWIYGQPPGKTIFVRFAGDKVVSVKQYPQ